MRVFHKDIRIRTDRREGIYVITEEVEKAVRESGVKNGVCLLFAPHATAALLLNENEEGLKTDILNKVLEMFPRDGEYRHNLIDDNANAHLASAFLKQHLVIPVIDGRLARGTWQEVMLLEMDGPRPNRRITVVLIGE